MADNEDFRTRLKAAIEASRRLDEFHEIDALRLALEKDDAGNFVVPGKDVPALFFHDRPGAATAVAAWVRHGGDPALLEAYGASLLRKAAQREDGRLDLEKVNAWAKQYHEPLSVLPGMLSKIEQLRASLERGEAFRRSPQQLFVDHDPETAIRMLFDSPDTTDAVRQMIDAIGDNPPILASLRRGVTDHLVASYVSANDPDGYTTFMTKHASALQLLFDPAQMRTLQAVGSDLKRSKKAVEGLPTRPTRWWTRILGR